MSYMTLFNAETGEMTIRIKKKGSVQTYQLHFLNVFDAIPCHLYALALTHTYTCMCMHLPTHTKHAYVHLEHLKYYSFVVALY